MCEHCGCSDDREYTITDLSTHDHSHFHAHNHTHENGNEHSYPPDYRHDHSHDIQKHEGIKIEIEQDVLRKNNLLAERNRGFFEAKNISVFNLVSSPGSGKTTLLEKTIKELSDKISISVIEGDQQSNLDAERIKATGIKVLQVNTGSGCHLDAGMINHSIKILDLKENSLLIIENVGNLVCPALFDLGEKLRVLIISVTEGEDKPLKYPYMFRSSDLCIINKIDLLPHLNFNLGLLKERALQINNKLEFIELSAKTMEGFNIWLDWIRLKTL